MSPAATDTTPDASSGAITPRDVIAGDERVSRGHRVGGRGVHLLGIRHHGPGSAATLLRALDELRPGRVLVELPSDTSSALALVASAGSDDAPDPPAGTGPEEPETLVPPVALLGYVVERPERAAFHPFARFSPEWQALRWGARHGVPVEPIDLPLAATLALRADRAPGGPDAIGLLARAAGYDDPERWWDDVVEHRGHSGRSAVDAFAAVAEAMAAVREGHVVPDGLEAAREASMRHALRAARRTTGDGPLAVVCGAWHVPALVELGGRVEEWADRELLRGERAKVAITWVPWTYRRLANATGYGAGVASPGWYDHVFAHPGDDGPTYWFARVAAALRDADLAASPDHVIAAVRLADALAALRDRPAPGLTEALDATAAVLAGGRRGALALVQDRLVVGDRLGRVPSSAPMVPLARDVQRQQRRLRLRPDADARVVELDLRLPLGRGRSQLLHRLGVLDVHWGRPQEGRGSSGSFRETWALRWEPELEIRLVEAAAHGTTLVAAATSRLRERAAAATSLGDMVGLVDAALAGDLPEATEPLMAALSGRVATEVDVAGLLDALTPLARTIRYGDARGTDLAALTTVVDGLVVRALVGLPQACRGLDDDGAAAMAERLSASQGALALLDHPARRAGWPAVLAVVAAADRAASGVHGVVQGRAVRLLHDAGAWPPTAVGDALRRALSVGTAPARGAAFVEGFLAGSGAVLLHDVGLVRLLDDWVASLGSQPFVDVVPLLRRTFGAFDAAERRQLGRLLAQDLAALSTVGTGSGAPPDDGQADWSLDRGRVDAALRTVAALLGLER